MKVFLQSNPDLAKQLAVFCKTRSGKFKYLNKTQLVETFLNKKKFVKNNFINYMLIGSDFVYLTNCTN